MKKFLVVQTEAGCRVITNHPDHDRIKNTPDHIAVTYADLAEIRKLSPYPHEWSISNGKLIKATEAEISRRKAMKVIKLPSFKKRVLSRKNLVILLATTLFLSLGAYLFFDHYEITIRLVERL